MTILQTISVLIGVFVLLQIGNHVWLYVKRLRAERRAGQRAQQWHEARRQERHKKGG